MSVQPTPPTADDIIAEIDKRLALLKATAGAGGRRDELRVLRKWIVARLPEGTEGA